MDDDWRDLPNVHHNPSLDPVGFVTVYLHGVEYVLTEEQAPRVLSLNHEQTLEFVKMTRPEDYARTNGGV